jgi:hypothetical protein
MTNPLVFDGVVGHSVHELLYGRIMKRAFACGRLFVDATFAPTYEGVF